jgi:hypothetical protein
MCEDVRAYISCQCLVNITMRMSLTLSVGRAQLDCKLCRTCHGRDKSRMQQECCTNEDLPNACIHRAETAFTAGHVHKMRNSEAEASWQLSQA